MKSPTLPGKTALCVQILHTGLFDDEPESFRKMDLFLKENHLIRKGHTHREIYLKDMSLYSTGENENNPAVHGV